MPSIQELIHRFEEGAGVRTIKIAAGALLLLALAVFYDLREFRNLTAPEAMDMAQVARHIADGKGFTTDCIRPLSLWLVNQHQGKQDGGLKTGHPDLQHPPLYPLVLAGIMKVLPFHYDIPEEQKFSRHQPDFLIALFNQALFFLVLWGVYQLAKRLFDNLVAWLACAVLVGSELCWRFSVSGLPTLLLMALFLALIACLARLDRAASQEGRSASWFAGGAAMAGGLVGLMGLTVYAFGWLLVPVIAFFLVFFAQRRLAMSVAALTAFVVVLSPWLARNYHVSGTPFGLTTYAVYQGTPDYPGTVLERSLELNTAKLNLFSFEDRVRKLFVNGRDILTEDLPKLGGNWLSAFFLVGLLVPFRNPTLSRLRLFLLGSLGVLGLAQAMGKTHLSFGSREITTENLLVVLAPMVFVYGAALYHLLLDQLEVPMLVLKQWITGAVVVALSAPLLLTLLPPRQSPVAFPPYYPWLIEQVGSFLKPEEMMMSDMPWAVAWYGRRQCSWLTLDYEDSYFAISDRMKPVKALFLTPVTMDERFMSQLVQGENRHWGQFLLKTGMEAKVPTGFPLRHAWSSIWPEHILLSDWQRWNKTAWASPEKTSP